jgi:hypothetical protein
LSLCTNINSTWIEEIHTRPETLKLVQEGAGNTLEAISIGKDFLRRTQVARQLKEWIDKGDSIKLISFCTTKEMVFKFKKLSTKWEKIFAS